VIEPFTPGARPVSALARVLAIALSGSPNDRAAIEQRLRAQPSEYAELIKDLTAGRPGSPGAVLLVIDQAEELLRRDDSAGPAGSQRTEFMKILSSGPRNDPHVQVILTLRSEFLGAMARDPELGPLVGDSEVVGPLPGSRLPEVIEGPARKAGIRFDPGLVQRIAAETVGGEALPLLGYALQQLYQKRQPSGLITTETYVELGGVDGALRQRAGEIQADLQARGYGDDIIPALIKLVAIDERNEPLKRQVPDGAFTPAQKVVIKAFVEARLLTTDSTDKGPGVTEVVHEALLRAWPPLQEAIDASREALRTQTGLERSASEWDRADREDSYLLYGDRLRQAEAWLAAHGPEAASTGRLREFIRSSRAAVDAVERERQALYDRAEARRLAGQAELARLSGQVSLSVVLALGVASVRRTATLEGDLALRRALEFTAVPLGGAAIAQGLYRLDVNNAGTMLACSANDGIHIFDSRAQNEMTILVQLGLSGHFAFAADGERLIVVAEMVEGEQAWLYATTSRQLLAKLGSPVTSCKVAVSANGKSVAVASDDQGRSGGARVYDTASGRQLHAFFDSQEYHRDNVLLGGVDLTGRGENSARGVAFAPDGRHLAVAWRTHVGVFELPGGDETVLDIQEVTALTFNATGKLLACGALKKLAVFDLEAGDEISLDEQSSGYLTAMVFSTRRPRILAIARNVRDKGVESGIVDLVDVRLGTRDWGIDLDQGNLKVAFGVGDATIAVGGADGRVRVFDVASGELVACYDHDGQVSAVRFIPQANVLASVGIDGALWLFSPVAGAERAVLRPGNRARTCAFTPDGTSLLVGGRYCGLSVWSLESGQRTRHLMEGMIVNQVALDRDGAVVAASIGPDESSIRTVAVFGYPAITEPSALRFETTVTAMALSPDGSIAAVGLEDGAVHLVDIGSGERRPAIELDGRPWALRFSPDGERLAAGSHGERGIGITQVFKVRTGTEVFRQEQNGPVSAVTFSPDGSRLAASGWDTSVRIRDAATGTEQLHLNHSGNVSDVKFNHDGTVLASVSHDGDVRIFDARTGAELSRIHHQVAKDQWLNAVAFSPDGSLVASAGDDGAVRLWPLGPGLLEQAQQRIARPPTPAEWRRYFAETPETPETPAARAKMEAPVDIGPRAPLTGLKLGDDGPVARRKPRWIRWPRSAGGAR
jgi:WD40 repeat protein